MPIFKIMSEESQGNDVSRISRQNDIGKNKVITTIVTEMANRLFTVCAIY